MKHVLRLFLAVLVCATTAAALKMALPRVSPLGGWWFWAQASLRNKLGLLVALPVYELWRSGWGYLLALGGLAATRHWWRRNRGRALGLGALLGAGQCAAGQLTWCLRAASIYARHAEGRAARPWYAWADWPEDLALLSLYALTGVVGAGLYYQWERARSRPGPWPTIKER